MFFCIFAIFPFFKTSTERVNRVVIFEKGGTSGYFKSMSQARKLLEESIIQ